MPNLPDLRYRSFQEELLDGENISPEALWQNLKELEIINRRLGGYQPLIKALNQLPPTHSPLRIVDIGCGGGDSLRVVSDWAKKNRRSVALSGVDIKADCLHYARKHSTNYDITWIQSDYRLLDTSWDIVMCSLFCHHLNTLQLEEFLLWAKTHAHLCLIINDLHRHPLAYYSIQLLTRCFSKSELVKHDAPLSVWRGFSRKELEYLLIKCRFRFQIDWVWAFRYLVVAHV